MLRYDSVYGRYPHEVAAADGNLVIDGTRIPAFAARDLHHPVIEVAHRRIGMERAVMSIVHAYTAGQELVDRPGRPRVSHGDRRPRSRCR